MDGVLAAAQGLAAQAYEFGVLGWAFAVEWIDYPAVRTAGLILLVLVTIRIMGGIYGGRIQNADYGPVSLRPHSNSGLREVDVRLPKSLVDMSLDGVRADCDIYYTYSDWRGRKRRVRVKRIRHSVINVMPTPLPNVRALIDGQEITDNIAELHTVDVVIPAPEADPAVSMVAPTEERVGDYIRVNKVLESWTDDDNAVRVSVHAKFHKEIGDRREAYILSGAERLRALREGNWWARQRAKSSASRRPGVVGSYYLRFKHSKDPFFILTRHPDRDLKMTAWLTLLTSLFAMAMEAWPLQGRSPVDNRTAVEQGGGEVRGVVRRP